MIDWINDLNTLRDSENNISDENYSNSSPTELMFPHYITVYVYEGEGTGIDGGGGVIVFFKMFWKKIYNTY